MPRRFVTLDVFTNTPLAGNPLAVVLDSDGLDTATMQTIAKEFNLSETVFVFPPADPARRADIRIFTPRYELPFAGHPTVGTAVLLALRGGLMTSESLVLGEQVGPVECKVTAVGAGIGAVRFRLPRLPQAWGEGLSRADVAQALELNVQEIGFDGHVPSQFGAGVPYDLVPVASLDALARVHVTADNFERFFGASSHPSVFVYARQGGSYRGRMFFRASGLAEDPATGSAVAAFAGVVMQFDKPGDGVHRLVIAQGYEMGRPSNIELTLEVRGGALAAAHIGGEAVIITEGMLHL
ncbi:MAG: PhzF family phenazine biosynthesis protein [Bosea sp. (in: a-proteobacteria)]